MSSHPVMPLSSPSLAKRDMDPVRNAMSVAGLSSGGVLLFVMTLLIVASGYTSLRPNVIGMRVHPYLFIIAVAFPFVVMSRMHEFPGRVLVPLLAFTLTYFFSVFSGASLAVNEIFKTGTAAVTIIASALMVRRRGDFVAAALGMCMAVALLAVKGLQEDNLRVGVEAMDGANKNTYSLYALPAMLMAGYIVLNMPTIPRYVKGALIGCTILALAVIFMGGNRSGWLGAALIALMLFWDRRGKGLLLIGIIALTVIVAIRQYGTTTVFDERVRQTAEGNKSDKMRQQIIITCFQLGFENPVIGVSPQQIGFEIGRRLPVGFRHSYVDSHNVFGHVVAASGLICFGALMWLGVSMFRWKARDGTPIGGKDDPLRQARKLMRMLIILWVVRGMFTREILYNPSFNIAIGLAIAMCLMAEKVRSKQPAGGSPALPNSGSMAGLPTGYTRPAHG